MTAWIYNPPEPTGQPTQPGPDLFADYIQAKADLVTRGRCGGCGACPKVWRLEIPYVVGDPYASTYAGVVYLQRVPYSHISAPDLMLGDYFADKCSWSQSLAPPFPDGNRNLGPYFEGWSLTYDLGITEGSGWSLYSPIESGDILFEPDARSRWIARDRWHCLEANRFQLWDTVGEHAFPYAPEFLTITPHPG